MDFADKIKFLREKILDMTQVELAKRLCVSRTSVHNWENGVSKPSTENIKTIVSAKLYSVPKKDD